MAQNHHFSIRRLIALGVAFVLLAAATPALALDFGKAAPRAAQTPARYHGHEIDLALDWEGAGACMVAPDALADIECFDTEDELIARVAELGLEDDPSPAIEGVRSIGGYECSSWTKLYANTWYGGASLWFRTRGLWDNLANYGFDQRVSSFKIGACQVIFADWSNGGGSWYPMSYTQPNDVDAILLSGWDNDISSFYIY